MEFSVWLTASIAVFSFATLVFIPAAIFRRNDYADVMWGLLFIVAAGAGLFFGAPEKATDLRSLICFSLISVWGLRLAYHIGRRAFSHSTEDVRYLNWRNQWGRTWLWRSYLQVFILQGFFSLVINAPMLWILSHPAQDIDIFTALGAAIWGIGFIFEAVSDAQLRRFRSNVQNKGKIMSAGLWSWSRHPNYFGEVVQWWGIFLIAVSLPWGVLTIVSPIAITFLILKVSGVPMLEELMKSRPGSEEYRRRTSIFFPLPPKT